MTVEEGIKMVVSGGIVTPEDHRSEEEQRIKRVAPASLDKRTIPYVEDDEEPAEEIEDLRERQSS